MTHRNVETLIGRLATDPAARRRFAEDPVAALREFREQGYELTPVEHEALATTDAGALRALSEESGWFVMMTPEYTERSTAFRRSVMEIENSAKEKNLDRAALGYVDMTLQCIRCHQFLRGTARADWNGLLLPRN